MSKNAERFLALLRRTGEAGVSSYIVARSKLGGVDPVLQELVAAAYEIAVEPEPTRLFRGLRYRLTGEPQLALFGVPA